MSENATGNETLVPVLVLRAPKPGPIVGITAVVHGNELNGISVIHELIESVNAEQLLRGTLVAVPIMNIPGYLNHQRAFEDGQDLNRIMPGKPDGNCGQLYAHRFLQRIASHFHYLIDLHTASFGRVNSLYVRADMTRSETAALARLISPQIIVHNTGGDGTFRAAMAEMGVHAVTVEVGDPQRFQHGLVQEAQLGIQGVLEYLEMVSSRQADAPRPCIECGSSYWLYTDRGGVLEVYPELAASIAEGEVIGRLRNVWGDLVREYVAPQAGVCVGKSNNPAARAGSRILHLGVPVR